MTGHPGNMLAGLRKTSRVMDSSRKTESIVTVILIIFCTRNISAKLVETSPDRIRFNAIEAGTEKESVTVYGIQYFKWCFLS